jgi:hypothetical protein
MPTDGNCFFHAVVDQLTRLNNKQIFTIGELREFTSNYLRENSQIIAPFLVDETPDQYIYRISEDRQWADHPFIHVLCQEFGINILIINNQHVNTPDVWNFVRSDQPNSQNITIGQLGELHYTSILPITDEGIDLLNQIIQMNLADYSPDQKRQALSELGDQGFSDVDVITSMPQLKRATTAPVTGTELRNVGEPEIKKARTPDPRQDKSRITNSFNYFQSFFTPKKGDPNKGGNSSRRTRCRHSKVRRFTKGRKAYNKQKRKGYTRKTHRKKYKTRRH